MKKASAGVLLVARGRMLLCKRTDSGLWATPGGRVEAGETRRQAASRELLEETGISVPEDSLALLAHSPKFSLYTVEIAEMVDPTLDKEHTTSTWAHPWKLPRPLHSRLQWLSEVS